MVKLHIWSDIPGDWRPSDFYDAHEHAGTKDGYWGVDSLSSLEAVFQKLASKGVVVNEMDFHTHGAPGCVVLGSECLSPFKLEQFRTPRFGRVFASGAKIIFLGCNIGEEPEGELLVAEVGSTLLNLGGGQVWASTGLGLADPLFTGDVYHPTGRWVIAHVNVGGAVRLEHHQHLHPYRVREKINELQSIILRRKPGATDLNTSVVESVKADIRRAASYIGGPAYLPSYRAIYWAKYYADQAENALGRQSDKEWQKERLLYPGRKI